MLRSVFKHRATKPERIDTGDYTPAEYERFLREIRFINQRLGDRAALEKTLLADIAKRDLKEFSVLDVGAGTGELLGVIAEFARSSGRKTHLVGLDLNELSTREIAAQSREHGEISPVGGNALALPFADDAFDYAICSLFTHHLPDADIAPALAEMSRIARRGIVIIDLERSVTAWLLYQLFCFGYGISPLVRHDGSLSIRKGFTCAEMSDLGKAAKLENLCVGKYNPYRIVATTI